MRRMFRVGMAVWMAVGLWSCSSAPRPVPVTAAGPDLQELAGQWSGEYHATGGGRQGTILFKLAAGAESATGEVLMFPKPPAPTNAGETGVGAVGQPLPQSLSIRFVRSEGGKISGTLDPYIDPECSCRVETTFEGVLAGDNIEGTYTANRTGNPAMIGTWKVKRKKT